MGSCPQFAALCWAIGLGIAAALVACAALALVVYSVMAFILGLIGRWRLPERR